jgi:hypothetical protein
MHLTFGVYVLLGANSLLELVVCAYAFRRRLYLRLPLFTAYLTLLFLRNLVLWWFYLGPGYDSRAAFDYFWVTQGLLLAARGAAIGEIAWRVLHRYRGIWAVGSLVLIGIALFLLIQAGLSAVGNRFWPAPFVLTAERGLELAAVVILVTLFYLSRYYGIRMGSVQRMVALGLGVYSAVQVINISFMQEWLTRYFHWWANIRVISFLVALAIWWLALRKPLPAERPAPKLSAQEIYDGLAPQVSFRLRKLNETLLELLKS